MFEIKDVFKFLENFSDFSKSEKVSTMEKLLKNKDFKKWLFCPDTHDKTIANDASRLYESLTKAKVMKCIIVTLDKNDFKFDRTTATIINSVANIALEAGSERINELVDSRKRGEISDKAYKKYREEAEEYLEVAKTLKKASKILIKDKAKKLAKVTELPKRLCYETLTTTPDHQFIDKFRVGVYLNNLLHNIYEIIEEESSSIFYIFSNGGGSYVWDDFFGYVFGDDDLVDIATFCLLEGFQRIKKYSSKAVTSAWDSLTEWALKQLEEAPESLRDQMLELYIKKITKMFQNVSERYDLRVDILNLPDKFRNLNKSVSKYKDRIQSILVPDKKKK